MPSSIITVTDDFGTRDGYVGQMKGVMLCINPQARIIDITHDIEPFSVIQAAFVLFAAAFRFPSETVHLAVVDPGVGGARRTVAVRADGHFFVGPDNGLFTRVIAECASVTVRDIASSSTGENPHPTFHGRDIFAPCAARLSLGMPFSECGPEIPDSVVLPIPKPVTHGNRLSGEVIYLDRFGNLSANIQLDAAPTRKMEISVGGVTICGLSRSFGDVPVGRPLALINSFGLLEIAVNQGNAADLLGVAIGAPVTVASE